MDVQKGGEAQGKEYIYFLLGNKAHPGKLASGMSL
jgi:hypothetical protein